MEYMQMQENFYPAADHRIDLDNTWNGYLGNMAPTEGTMNEMNEVMMYDLTCIITTS